MSWDPGMWLQPQALLSREQMVEMSADEMSAFFEPYMSKPPEGQTAVITAPPRGGRIIHLYTSLHSKRPACGARLPFEPDCSTFSKPHATCGHCLQTVSKEAA